MENTKPWYKKKRYIVPSAFAALFIALIAIGSHNQPRIQSKTQTDKVGQTTVTTTPVLPVYTNSNDQTKTVNSNIESNTAQTTKSSTVQSNTSAKTSTSTNTTTSTTTQTKTSTSPTTSTTSSQTQSPTALCNDGTLSYSQTHSGTCSHHGGVKIWYK